MILVHHITTQQPAADGIIAHNTDDTDLVNIVAVHRSQKLYELMHIYNEGCYDHNKTATSP